MPPSWEYEEYAYSMGFERVVGIDEAGRGPLAGPVVAAAVIFPRDFRMKGLADSKKLSPKRREDLARQIRDNATVGVAAVFPEDIERYNILGATNLAVRAAVRYLKVQPDYFITDYLYLNWAEAPVVALEKGDARCASVAAASILAKVARDRIMTSYDSEFPGYGFAEHKGYATAAHMEALRTLGPTTIHRLTFRGTAWFNTSLRPSKTFQRLAQAIAAMDSPQASQRVGEEIACIAPSLPERERAEIEQLYQSRLTTTKRK
ncbi:ribonuclease HII [Candidatus Sumerlaeota bacterium]|nr:ribonuclease HII [Candidatus Sumerlaeota bacterium]